MILPKPRRFAQSTRQCGISRRRHEACSSRRRWACRARRRSRCTRTSIAGRWTAARRASLRVRAKRPSAVSVPSRSRRSTTCARRTSIPTRDDGASSLGVERVLAVREAIGPERDLMVDCHWRLDERAASDTLARLEPARLYWLECPLPETGETLGALKRLRAQANARGARLAGCEAMTRARRFSTVPRRGRVRRDHARREVRRRPRRDAPHRRRGATPRRLLAAQPDRADRAPRERARRLQPRVLSVPRDSSTARAHTSSTCATARSPFERRRERVAGPRGARRRPRPREARRARLRSSACRESRMSASPLPSPRLVLTLSCTDRPGIVGAVGTFLAQSDGNIVESAQFGDVDTPLHDARRFERCGVTERRIVDAGVRADRARASAWTGSCTTRIGGRACCCWSRSSTTASTTCSTATASARCRSTSSAIVSNHRDLAELAGVDYDVPFHHLPVTRDDQAEAEASSSSWSRSPASTSSCSRATCRSCPTSSCGSSPGARSTSTTRSCPSFKGAKPYHQAHARGVKLIGATAHYVTADLDEGPIIEQEVVRVDHTITADAAGRGGPRRRMPRARARRQVPRRARVFLNGAKTVVFR